MIQRLEIDPAEDYCVSGRRLMALRRISAQLNDPKPLTWDERRDAANMLDLLVSESFAIRSDR